MPFMRYRAFWNVPGGGTGISNFYTSPSDATGAQAAANAVRAMFLAIATTNARIPNDVSFTFDSEATIHADDGTLTSVLVVGSVPASVTGAGAGGWAGGIGVKVNWETDAVISGRRLVGHTYWVPAASGCFDTDGTLTAAAITDFRNPSNAYLTALGSAGLEGRVVSLTSTSSVSITTATVTDKSAIMRSRRDG